MIKERSSKQIHQWNRKHVDKRAREREQLMAGVVVGSVDFDSLTNKSGGVGVGGKRRVQVEPWFGQVGNEKVPFNRCQPLR